MKIAKESHCSTDIRYENFCGSSKLPGNCQLQTFLTNIYVILSCNSHVESHCLMFCAMPSSSTFNTDEAKTVKIFHTYLDKTVEPQNFLSRKICCLYSYSIITVCVAYNIYGIIVTSSAKTLHIRMQILYDLV